MSETNTQYVDRAGAFLCVVQEPTSGWFGEAGEKQTPFIRIVGKVTGDGDQKDRIIIWQGWLSDGAFDNTIKALAEAFPAWDGDLASLQNGSFTFAGLECQIVTEVETYENKPRVKAKWLNPAGGGAKPMEKAKVDSIGAKLGRRAQAIVKATHAGGGDPAAKTAATPAPSRPVPVPTAPENDDIPF